MSVTRRVLGLPPEDQTLARRPTALSLQWEELWLRLLPSVMRNYSWAPVDGFQMFGSKRHHRYLRWLKKGRVEPFTAHLFREHVGPGMAVVDVGAYLGYYTLLGARGTGGTGKVHAFECNPVNHRFLLHNLRLNGFARDVVVSASALADRAGCVSFFIRGSDLSDGSLWQEDSVSRVIEVTTTTLDHELAGQPVDVLKMDVEGGELRALDGMTTTIEASSSLVMFVECNPTALAASGNSALDLLDRLRELEFDVSAIDEKRRTCQPISEALVAEESARNPEFYVNLYCRKQ